MKISDSASVETAAHAYFLTQSIALQDPVPAHFVPAGESTPWVAGRWVQGHVDESGVFPQIVPAKNLLAVSMKAAATAWCFTRWRASRCSSSMPRTIRPRNGPSSSRFRKLRLRSVCKPWSGSKENDDARRPEEGETAVEPCRVTADSAATTSLARSVPILLIVENQIADDHAVMVDAFEQRRNPTRSVHRLNMAGCLGYVHPYDSGDTASGDTIHNVCTIPGTPYIMFDTPA